jgi:hypothetical protein
LYCVILKKGLVQKNINNIYIGDIRHVHVWSKRNQIKEHDTDHAFSYRKYNTICNSSIPFCQS